MPASGPNTQDGCRTYTGAKMKNCTETRGLLSNGKFSTLDWPTPEMIAAAHRARGKALREMTSVLYHRLWSTLAGVAGVETAPADRAGFFSRLYAAITKSRQCSADRHVARHQHLLDRLAGRIEPAGTGGRPGVVATSRTRAEDDVAARYVGDRWCDTTERKLNDELMAGHRGSFMP